MKLWKGETKAEAEVPGYGYFIAEADSSASAVAHWGRLWRCSSKSLLMSHFKTLTIDEVKIHHRLLNGNVALALNTQPKHEDWYV